DMAVRVTLFEKVLDGQDGAAEVAQDDHAVARVSPGDGVPHGAVGGAQTAVWAASGRLHLDALAGDLRGQPGQAVREFKTVRHKYNSDQVSAPPQSAVSLHYRQQFSNAE